MKHANTSSDPLVNTVWAEFVQDTRYWGYGENTYTKPDILIHLLSKDTSTSESGVW